MTSPRCPRCNDTGAVSWICDGCELGDMHMHTEPCPDCEGKKK